MIKKDVTQIHRSEHDAQANARRVKMVDTEISIELDHRDGDSVTSHPDKLVVCSKGITQDDQEVIPAMPCSSIKKFKMYCDVKQGMKDCTFKLQVSPSDSEDVWFDASEMPMDHKESVIVDVCARRFRVVQTMAGGTYEIDLHLVGQG